MTRRHYLLTGSVSSATLRNEDLIPRFADHLNALDAMTDNLRAGLAEWRQGIMDADEQSEFIGELMDALDAQALPYWYFGAHPNDGADFGFWLLDDWQEIMRGDGDLIVDDVAKIPADFFGNAAVVNDHGNITLYACDEGKLTEVWSVV